MTPVQKRASETWNTMLERDLDALVQGEAPLNSDLVPLSAFLAGLEQFGSVDLDTESATTCAETAAAIVRTRRASAPTPAGPKAQAENLPFRARLKNRATAFATSVLMVGSMTGVAWAADGAAPGDFLYGLDRALEAVGIGAGGIAERLAEKATTDDAPGFAETEQLQDHQAEDTPSESSRQSIGSERTPAGAAAIHDYLESTDRTDGHTVAEMAKLVAERNKQDTGKPENKGKPDGTGKPEDPGKPANTGKPENAGKP